MVRPVSSTYTCEVITRERSATLKQFMKNATTRTDTDTKTRASITPSSNLSFISSNLAACENETFVETCVEHHDVSIAANSSLGMVAFASFSNVPETNDCGSRSHWMDWIHNVFDSEGKSDHRWTTHNTKFLSTFIVAPFVTLQQASTIFHEIILKAFSFRIQTTEILSLLPSNDKSPVHDIFASECTKITSKSINHSLMWANRVSYFPKPIIRLGKLEDFDDIFDIFCRQNSEISEESREVYVANLLENKSYYESQSRHSQTMSSTNSFLKERPMEIKATFVAEIAGMVVGSMTFSNHCQQNLIEDYYSIDSYFSSISNPNAFSLASTSQLSSRYNLRSPDNSSSSTSKFSLSNSFGIVNFCFDERYSHYFFDFFLPFFSAFPNAQHIFFFLPTISSSPSTNEPISIFPTLSYHSPLTVEPFSAFLTNFNYIPSKLTTSISSKFYFMSRQSYLAEVNNALTVRPLSSSDDANIQHFLKIPSGNFMENDATKKRKRNANELLYLKVKDFYSKNDGLVETSNGSQVSFQKQYFVVEVFNEVIGLFLVKTFQSSQSTFHDAQNMTLIQYLSTQFDFSVFNPDGNSSQNSNWNATSSAFLEPFLASMTPAFVEISILNPLFATFLPYISQELLRISNKSILLTQSARNTATIKSKSVTSSSNSNSTSILAQLFTPLRPLFSGNIASAAKSNGEDLPSSTRSNIASVSFATRHSLAHPRKICSRRIFFIGCSDSALFTLENFVYHPKIYFPNIVWVSSSYPMAIDLARTKLTANGRGLLKSFPQDLAFPNYKEFISIVSAPNVKLFRNSVNSIDRVHSKVGFNNDSKFLFYDELVLATGTETALDADLPVKILNAFSLNLEETKENSSDSPTCVEMSTLGRVEPDGVFGLSSALFYNTEDDPKSLLHYLQKKQLGGNVSTMKFCIYGTNSESIFILTKLLTLGALGENIYWIHPSETAEAILPIAHQSNPIVEQILLSINSANINIRQNTLLESIETSFGSLDAPSRPLEVSSSVKSEIRALNLKSTGHSELSVQNIPCDVLIFTDQQQINRDILSSIFASKLLFDKKLVVDSSFKTSDNNIFALGTHIKFSRRYLKWNRQFYYSQRSIGNQLRADEKTILESKLDEDFEFNFEFLNKQVAGELLTKSILKHIQDSENMSNSQNYLSRVPEINIHSVSSSDDEKEVQQYLDLLSVFTRFPRVVSGVLPDRQYFVSAQLPSFISFISNPHPSQVTSPLNSTAVPFSQAFESHSVQISFSSKLTLASFLYIGRESISNDLFFPLFSLSISVIGQFFYNWNEYKTNLSIKPSPTEEKTNSFSNSSEPDLIAFLKHHTYSYFKSPLFKKFYHQFIQFWQESSQNDFIAELNAIQRDVRNWNKSIVEEQLLNGFFGTNKDATQHSEEILKMFTFIHSLPQMLNDNLHQMIIEFCREQKFSLPCFVLPLPFNF